MKGRLPTVAVIISVLWQKKDGNSCLDQIHLIKQNAGVPDIGVFVPTWKHICSCCLCGESFRIWMSRRKGNYTKSVIRSGRLSGRTDRTPRAMTKKKRGAHSCSQVGPSPVLSVGHRMGARATTRLAWVHTARGAWERARPLTQRGVHAVRGGRAWVVTTQCWELWEEWGPHLHALLSWRLTVGSWVLA
jgi:hypothetical protein